MNILIIGATGSLASKVIETAEQFDSLNLTLFTRNTSRLSKRHTLFQGNANNVIELTNAMQNIDVVYVNLAGDLTTYSQNIITAMQQTGIKRVIAISSIGIYDKPVKAILEPYRALANNFEASGLDYTIIRPDWFTDENSVDYHITHKGEPEVGGAVSRASIADFIVKIFINPSQYLHENVGISKL